MDCGLFCWISQVVRQSLVIRCAWLLSALGSACPSLLLVLFFVFTTFFSTQQVLPTQNKTYKTALNATLIFPLNLALVFILSEVLSTLSLSTKWSTTILFAEPLKVPGPPWIISNMFSQLHLTLLGRTSDICCPPSDRA